MIVLHVGNTTGTNAFPTLPMKMKPNTVALAALVFVTAPANAAAVIYEPFNYATGGLNGKFGLTEEGLTGAWAANADTVLEENSLSYGLLSTAGNKFRGKEAINRYGGSRAISASALSTSGLLVSNSELWFSVIIGKATTANSSNTFLALALASDTFITSNGNTRPLTAGQGVGIDWTGTQPVRASSFSTAAPVVGTSTASLYAPGEFGLIVGKILWGDTTDTITLYQPDINLTLGAAVSTLETTVDQSAFDTLTFRWGSGIVMDEIRFGANYASVTPIPEPSTALLGAIGAIMLLRRRR